MKKFGMALSALFFTVSGFAGNNNSTCGLSGSLEQRIKDCGNTQRQGLVLVTRAKSGKYNYNLVVMERKSRKLWSDIIKTKVTPYSAIRACGNSNLYDKSELGFGVAKKWRLPSEQEYKKVLRIGFESVIRLDDRFVGVRDKSVWTSTSTTSSRGGLEHTYFSTFRSSSYFARLYDRNSTGFGRKHESESAYFRCVADL